METIPYEMKPRISQEKNLEIAQKTGKWVDLKVLF
jgi:hypothetical protein